MVSSVAGVLGPTVSLAAVTGNIPVETVWCGSTGMLRNLWNKFRVPKFGGTPILGLVVVQSLRHLVVSQMDEGELRQSGGSPDG